MKIPSYIIQIILIAGITFILGMVQLPWWIGGLVALVIACVFSLDTGKAFIIGFVALFLLWLICSMTMDAGNDGLLSTKIAELIKLPNRWILIFLTGLIGGITGGLGALLGGASAKLISNK